MVIDPPPEFDPIIESRMEPIERFMKQFESERRLVNASAARNEEERTKIINFPSAFSYKAHVKNGIFSIERNPHFENDKIIDDIIIETKEILQTVLPEKLSVIMDELKPEFAEMLKSHIVEILQSSLGGKAT